MRLLQPCIREKEESLNRSRILECIYRNAPIARTDIAEETEITPATVTMNVTTLISEGFVKELGEVSTDEGSSGRKRVLIDIIPGRAYSIGLEFTPEGPGHLHHRLKRPHLFPARGTV